MPIERLQAFYRTWYQPDNAVLVVAGDFDPGTTLQVINEAFGAIPRPQRELPRFYTVEPAQDGERSVTVRRVGEAAFVAVAYHAPAGRHPDSAAMTVLGQILGHSPTGRHLDTGEISLFVAGDFAGAEGRDPTRLEE